MGGKKEFRTRSGNNKSVEGIKSQLWLSVHDIHIRKSMKISEWKGRGAQSFPSFLLALVVMDTKYIEPLYFEYVALDRLLMGQWVTTNPYVYGEQ